MKEFRIIEYRCAITGGSFRIQFGRNQATDKFRVVATERASWPTSVKNMLANRLRAWLPRWLLAVVARFTRLANLLRRSTVCSFATDEFDFSAWCCPCCGFEQGEADLFAFVHCPQCDGLVCGGRLSAGSHFRCHDGCGHAETCTDTMQRIDGSISNRDPRTLGSPRKTLAAALRVGHSPTPRSANE